MALTNYVNLGKSGLRVSPLCLGTMTFGNEWGWGSDVKESEAVLSRYLDLGGNFVDTANGYTLGHSEAIIGDYFSRNQSKRNKTVLATKFCTSMDPGDPNAGGANRKSIVAACEESLRRLKTGHIDLYWMHFWDKWTPVEETMRALDDLVTAGKVRYVGFSDTPAWKVAQAQTIAQFRGFVPLAALQIEYSLLERTVEGELIPMAMELGLGVTPWGPLKSGVLSGKYTRANHGNHVAGRGDWALSALNPKAYDLIEEVVAVAKELEVPPARVALSWVQGRPGVSSSLVGARTVVQLDENLLSLSTVLSAQQKMRLDDLSRPQLNFPHDFVERVGAIAYGGTTINGVSYGPSPLAPREGQRYY
jgi:aryl-alcohol dehydrogenase-like predicted oxidoreductase